MLELRAMNEILSDVRFELGIFWLVAGRLSQYIKISLSTQDHTHAYMPQPMLPRLSPVQSTPFGHFLPVSCRNCVRLGMSMT